MGDGEALLGRFLQESSVSVPIVRAVELAGERSVRPAVEAHRTFGDIQLLQDQLAAIQTAIAPFAQQLRTSPARKAFAARESAQLMQSAAIQQVTQQAIQANSPAMKAFADLARRLQSPAIQRLAKQYSEIAEVSRLARTISESVEASDLATAVQEDSE
jgi:hypothetical protein